MTQKCTYGSVGFLNLKSSKFYRSQIVNVLETEALAKSDKFTKLASVPIVQKSSDIRTFVFESESSDVFVVVRVYEKSLNEEGLVHVTLAVELKS